VIGGGVGGKKFRVKRWGKRVTDEGLTVTSYGRTDHRTLNGKGGLRAGIVP